MNQQLTVAIIAAIVCLQASAAARTRSIRTRRLVLVRLVQYQRVLLSISTLLACWTEELNFVLQFMAAGVLLLAADGARQQRQGPRRPDIQRETGWYATLRSVRSFILNVLGDYAAVHFCGRQADLQ